MNLLNLQTLAQLDKQACTITHNKELPLEVRLAAFDLGFAIIKFAAAVEKNREHMET